MQYRHITLQQRIKIELLISQEFLKSDIARQVNIHSCTLSRGLKHCFPSAYNAQDADDHYHKKKRKCGRKYVIDVIMKDQINNQLRQDWSPEQIHGFYRYVSKTPRASPETIYQYIYRDKTYGGVLYIHQRRKRKYRHNRTHT